VCVWGGYVDQLFNIFIKSIVAHGDGPRLWPPIMKFVSRAQLSQAPKNGTIH
jgi:hypothetical protein